jgi:hypothetical protein
MRGKKSKVAPMATLKRTVWYKCLTLAFALVLFAGGGSVVLADSEAASFAYFAGSGFLCGFPGGCPDIARAANRDTIELSLAGTLSIHPKSVTTVTGGGTFTHKSAAGVTLATGGVTALDLLSFDDFGPGSPGSSAHGGIVLIRVHLTPSTGGPGVDAILEVNCSLGRANPAHSQDFVRLAVERGPNFNEGVSGFTVFIKLP